MTRPLPITVIAWVTIALSVEGLITLIGGIATPIFASGVVPTPLSIPATLWVSGVGLCTYLVLGVLILAGFGWARIAYLALLGIALLNMLLGRAPVSLAVITAIKLMLFSYFFFQRESNDYFAKSGAGAA